MNRKRAFLITCIIRKGLTSSLLSHLANAGVKDYGITPVRTLALHESRRALGLFQRFRLVEEPGEMLHFLVGPDQEEAALDYVARGCELTVPGRGSVYSQEVDLLGWEKDIPHALFPVLEGNPVVKHSSLVGICCVLQRGQANEVARVALDMGLSVPAISFGHGMGIRDRLGLLRVAIPGQKEIIHIAASGYDAETLMRMMIRTGQLDRPGKGFIYLYPIGKGLVDTKITHGAARHVASVEQIIAVLDELKGDVGWRRRSHRELVKVDPRHFLGDLLDLSVVCNEGSGKDLVKAAMRAGAGGATISRMKQFFEHASRPKGMSSAREVCDICVNKNMLGEVLGALEESGLFQEEASGEVWIRKALKAYTYNPDHSSRPMNLDAGFSSRGMA